MRIWLPVTLLAVIPSLGVGASLGAAAPRTAAGSVIAYVGKGTIYTISADGTDRRALLSSSADDTFAWSPDGTRIAFTSGRWGGFTWAVTRTFALSVANADGSGIRRVTPSRLEAASEPTWSPDGTQIAFSAWSGLQQRYALYVIGSDGRGLRMLTDRPGNGWSDEDPDWSSDGAWLVFERYPDDGARSWIMAVHPDGTGLHRIATVITGDHADGMGVRRVTRDPWYSALPRWQPVPPP